MESKTFVFDPRPNYPLLITANRYPFSEDSEGLTLVFAHGTGFHKEQWEPTIEDLKKLLEDDRAVTKIREVWSIEAPNHGDSAILNEEVLRLGYTPICEYCY
jgi:hydroxymethylglutaryl-CoA lyase